MSKSDVNGILRSYNGEKLKVFEAARAQKAAIEEMQKQAAEIDTYARANIKDYKKLSSPAQSQIRRIIEDGRAKGVSDSDVLAYAKVAAHSGLDIVFDKGMNYRGVNEQGDDTYSDGFYSASRNTIFVNPEASRTQERLLIHELDHAIRKIYDKKGTSSTAGGPPSPRGRLTRVYKTAVDGVSEDIKKSIKEKYGDDPDVNADEANAYYAEIAFSNKHVLEKLIEAEPSLKEKILSFFKGAAADYADVPKLSGAAKRYYRTYKKLFDEFSARNAENNAMEPFTNKNGSNVNEKGVSDNVRTINGNNMSVSDNGVKFYALSDSYSEKDSIKSQLRQNESVVNEMSPVDNVNYDVVDKKKAREDAKQLYKSLGYKVDRQNFGIIEIGEKEISESSNYLNTKAEFAAWMTVPKVLKRGKLISDHANHKNEGFSTYTIAAPVVINGVRGNVAVTVKKTGKNRYKAHRILMPDGSQFVYENIKKDAEPTGSDIATKKASKGPDISSASISSIPQKPEKSNGFDKNSLENSSDKQFALPIDVDNFVANGEEFATPTLSTVGKERMTYKEKAFSKDWLFTKKTSAYIHAVDEMFGIQVYLEKIGGAKNAKASIQSVRSAPHQAQTMIGSVQYDMFSKVENNREGNRLERWIYRQISPRFEKIHFSV